MTKKYTDWFPPEVKPVRVGVYQRRRRAGRIVTWSHYENGKWGWSSLSAETAFEKKHIPSGYQDAHWRGLLTPSK